MESRLVPFAPVEWGVLVRIGADFLQALENKPLAIGRRHDFAIGKPIAARAVRKVSFIVVGRKRPRFHVGQRSPRCATSSRKRLTIFSGGVSCSRTSLTPIFFKATTSSS